MLTHQKSPPAPLHPVAVIEEKLPLRLFPKHIVLRLDVVVSFESLTIRGLLPPQAQNRRGFFLEI